jgi:uncharacterized integral membrane protein (TIGR00697 family)
MTLAPEQKQIKLFTILCGIFITNAIVAELIGVKLFSGEQTLGLQPAHLNIMGFVMDFNLTAGAVIWPMVFITSDLINEYFGRTGVKRISYLTVMLISYAFVVILLARALPPAGFWMDLNSRDADGNHFNIEYAFDKIFGQGQRIIIGSIVAFLVSQLLDALVFQRLRQLTGAKMLWVRATGSTLVSQLIDSFVVLFIAFSGTFTTAQIVAIGITNYIYKFAVAVLLTPVVYLGHGLIDSYLGKDHASKMSEEAATQKNSFF